MSRTSTSSRSKKLLPKALYEARRQEILDDHKRAWEEWEKLPRHTDVDCYIASAMMPPKFPLYELAVFYETYEMGEE